MLKLNRRKTNQFKMAFITQQKTQLSIPQIVLQTIEQIRELSKLEFRGGYSERKFEGTSWNDVYIPDVRKQVIQSIDFLRMLVQPRFDKQIKGEYAKIMEEQDKNFKENSEKDDLEQYTINKLKLMLKLFESINLFFERKKYFKSQAYEEIPEEEKESE